MAPPFGRYANYHRGSAASVANSAFEMSPNRPTAWPISTLMTKADRYEIHIHYQPVQVDDHKGQHPDGY
jgi:hypothetical protein